MSLPDALNEAAYEYRSFTHILNTEDNIAYLTYGIEVYRHDISGSRKVDCIYDITTRPQKISQLLELLNRAQVSPRHFRDTVEDYLS